jgi:cytochrome c553
MARVSVVKTMTVAMGLAISTSSLFSGSLSANELEQAMTLKPDLENGLDVYVVCSACHMPEGWGVEEGTFPQLAGQHRSVLIKQLADIRSRNRDNPTMYPFSLPESIGDEQAVADVAAYIEQLKMNPENGKGEWAEGTSEYDNGKKLFKTSCVQCHGENGEGDAEKLYPKIQGQHYNYMVRQIEWILNGKRRNANPDMVKIIKTFSKEDITSVINYVSRIPVPKDKLAPSAEWKNPDFE